jgi:hypothetical protein
MKTTASRGRNQTGAAPRKRSSKEAASPSPSKFLKDGDPGYDEATKALIKAQLAAHKAGLTLPTIIQCFLSVVSVTDPGTRVNIKVT